MTKADRKPSGRRSRIPAFFKQQTVRPPDAPDNWVDPICQWRSDAEARFAQLWAELYPQIDLVHEYQFLEKRQFRFDFAHIASKTAIEIQGGVYVPGMGHSSGKGLQSDYEKARLAGQEGWVIVPIAAHNVDDADLLAVAARTIETRSGRIVV